MLKHVSDYYKMLLFEQRHAGKTHLCGKAFLQNKERLLIYYSASKMSLKCPFIVHTAAFQLDSLY